MTNTAFKEGMVIFTTTFSAVKSDTKTQKVWFMLLRDLTDEQFKYAVTKICREVKTFFPTDNFAAMVREQLAVNMDNEALIAWEAAKKATALQGAYTSVKFSDPVIHSVVKILSSGWSDFCHIPQNNWLQRDFIENYKAIANRKEHPEYLKGIHDTINNISEPKPTFIETGTGRHKAIEGHVSTGGNKVTQLAQSLTEKMK